MTGDGRVDPLRGAFPPLAFVEELRAKIGPVSTVSKVDTNTENVLSSWETDALPDGTVVGRPLRAVGYLAPLTGALLAEHAVGWHESDRLTADEWTEVCGRVTERVRARVATEHAAVPAEHRAARRTRTSRRAGARPRGRRAGRR